MKDRLKDEELNQQMTDCPPRKEFSPRSIEKQSAVSNYVSQVVRKEVGQEQERHEANVGRTEEKNMKQTWDRTEEINNNGHIIQEKKRQNSSQYYDQRECNFCASQTRRTSTPWKKQ